MEPQQLQLPHGCMQCIMPVHTTISIPSSVLLHLQQAVTPSLVV
jgi:hypothetical protein